MGLNRVATSAVGMLLAAGLLLGSATGCYRHYGIPPAELATLGRGLATSEASTIEDASGVQRVFERGKDQLIRPPAGSRWRGSYPTGPAGNRVTRG